MQDYNQLNAKLDEKASISLGNSLSLSWSDFTRELGLYLGFFFLSMIASIIIGFIVPFGGFIISPFITLGYLTFVHFSRTKPDSYGFNDFFAPFQKFGPVLLTFLFVILISLIPFLPLLFTGVFAIIKNLNDPTFLEDLIKDETLFTPALIFSLIAIITISIILNIFLMTAPLFAYFYNVKPIEAVKLSFKFGRKHFFHLFLLQLTKVGLAFVGLLMCFIGLFITAPLSQILLYYSFAGIMGLEDETEPKFEFEQNQQ